MHRSSSSNNHAHHDAAEPAPPQPATIAESTLAMPEIIAPRGVVLALDSMHRIHAGDHGALHGAWSTEPSDRSKFFQGDLAQHTTAAGDAGADCQPVWGTVVQHHFATVDYDSDAVMTARLADVLELESIASHRRDGGVRLWVAEVIVNWSADELADKRNAVKIELIPLAEFMAEQSTDHIPATLLHRRMEAAEELTRRLSDKQLDVRELISSAETDPYAGECIHIPGTMTTSLESERHAVKIAGDLCRRLAEMPHIELPSDVRHLIEKLRPLVGD